MPISIKRIKADSQSELETQNILLSNQNEKLLVELEEIHIKYNAMHKTFLELLEITLEYRERMGLETNRDFEYDYLEKAKLL